MTAEPAVTVQLVGQMRRPRGVGDESRVAWRQGQTVDEVLAELGYLPTERRLLRVLLDDETVGPRTAVPPDATLVVFLPIGGG